DTKDSHEDLMDILQKDYHN
ncbi:unnamed protein product, partial [Allacma fusca]